MSKWFMLHGHGHHRVDEGIYLHYADTCNVQDLPIEENIWAKRSTDIGRIEPFSDRRVVGGVVEIRYETKGRLTFFAQIDINRAAWQRIEWRPNLPKGRDWQHDREVQNALEQFLWVARCEEERKILPK